MGIRDSFTRLVNSFIQFLPEDANKKTTMDDGNVAKTSPWLFDYDVFKINWHKVDLLQRIDEMVREDGRIKRANHIFASTAVRRGLSIKASSAVSEKLADQAQTIIDDMMRRTQINSKLTTWSRSLLKDGELFLNPVVDVKQKIIIDIKNLPALTMQRNEDITGRFPDLNDAFRQIDPVSRTILSYFPLWSINHIRYDHESGQLYGNSQYMGCLPIWHKLKMMEQDMVVRRRTRAVPRRLHIVGNKDNPQDWSKVEEYKAKNKLNGKNAQVQTDYFGNGLTDIKDLNADAYLDHIGDVEYIQQLLMISTGVPLYLLGFGADINRDIVEDQKKQFDEAVQELRDLLEHGDEAPYSGIRALIDFQLQLQGIDPELIDYNFQWSENNEDTVDNKVDRVIKLREVQPMPLISAKTALAYLGRDLNLENQEAIDAEIEAIKEEVDEERQAVQAEAAAINPITQVKSGVDRTVVNTSGTPSQKPQLPATDAKQKRKNPLHNKKVVELEKSYADEVQKFFSAVWNRMKENGIEAKIEQIKKLKPHVDSVEPMSEYTRILLNPHDATCNCSECMTDAPKQVPLNRLVEQNVIDEFDAAWSFEDDPDNAEASYSISASTLSTYLEAGTLAYDFVNSTLDQAGVGINLDFVHSGVKNDFSTHAGERITGIENTTKQMLRVEMAEAYQNGETLQQWMDRIENVIGDIPDWRSSMIARTEVSWAYNRANMVAYKQAGVSRVQYVAVLDSRTCPRCQQNAEGGDDGVYDIGSVPSVPAHPRCRCTTIAVI